ncbi:MAG: DUF31 family protein [Ureaplasma sp.]|nr:DUF31 family protein [Ureaplasma sp.]
MNKKTKIGVIISSLLATATIPAVALYVTSCSNIDSTSNESHINITNATQQYANDNSISLGFEFQPDYGYAADKLEEFFINNDTLIPNSSIENYIVQNIREQAPGSLQNVNLLFGTSWMIDYKLNTSNYKNTYYLATNTHVLDLSYVIKVSELNLEFTFPVNGSSVNFLNLYLSQPQGESELNSPFNASYSKFETDWYKTNINESNINSSIIQYANNSSNTFDFSIASTTQNFNENDTILVGSDNKTSTINEQITNTSNNNMGIDSSILKLELNPNAISNNSTQYAGSKQIRKLRKIFDVNENYEDKTSNYISKLKNTYSELQNNQISSYRESSTFPFELNNPGTELTVGGFPGDNKGQYTYFNTGTTNTVYYNEKINRPYIRFLNGNKLSFVKYDAQDTSFLGGINLMPGSSGSMVLNNENKIVGIYWGATTSLEYGLFIPFEYNNNLLFTRLTNFIKSNAEFEGSALRNIFDYQSK